MAITASQVTTNNSLEQFRQEFNNLQSDVRGLESGTVSFSTVATNLQLIFEGATDDDNETTLGVIDPTPDRTINLPNASGTVFLQEDTDNGIITGKTTITSGDVTPTNDELLLSDADAGVLKRVTVNNLISSAGGLTAVSRSGLNLVVISMLLHLILFQYQTETLIFYQTVLVWLILMVMVHSGGVSISDGLIDIRTGTGSVSKVKFYCESSNAHAQTLQAQPHSASSSAVLTLPVAYWNIDWFW